MEFSTNHYENFGRSETPVGAAHPMPGRLTTATAGGPPQVIFIQAPRLKRSFDKYASMTVYILGWIQIGCGLMSIILGIANPLTCGLYGMIGYGIWGGLLYIAAGMFGIISAQRKTSHSIITHMVLTVISAVCALVQFALSVTSAYYDNLVYGCYYYTVSNEQSIDYAGTVAVDSLLAVFAFVQGVAAIMASALSCKVVCCSSAFKTINDTGNSQYVQGMGAGGVAYYSSPIATDQMAYPYSPASSHDVTLNMQNGKQTMTVGTSTDITNGVPSVNNAVQSSLAVSPPPYSIQHQY